MHKTDYISQDIKYVQKIFEQNNQNQESNHRIAIIGRKRAQIIPYQIYFASEGIPFCADEDLSIFLSDAFDKLLQLLEVKAGANNEQDKPKLVKQILKLCNLVKLYPLKKAKQEDLRKHFNNSEADFQNMSQAIDVLYSHNEDMATRLQKFIDADTVSEALESLSDNFGLQYDFSKAEDDIFYADPPFFCLAEYVSKYNKNYQQFARDVETAKERLDNPQRPGFELLRSLAVTGERESAVVRF